MKPLFSATCRAVLASVVLMAPLPSTAPLGQPNRAFAQAPDRLAAGPAARGIIDVDGGLVQIAAQRDGVVREVFVEEGQAVMQNQPLVVIDDQAARVQIAVATAQRRERLATVKVATVRVETARRERDRLAPLARSRAVPQKSFDDAEAELRAATAELGLRNAEADTAEAQLRSAEYEREVRTIRAPSHGTIVRRLVRPGDGLSTLNVTPLFWFAPATERIIRAEIDEQFSGSVQEGQLATFALEVSQDRVAGRGRVVRLGRAYGPRRATTYEPRERADVRVLEAILAFDGEPPSVPLGQRVIVRFLSEGTRP